MRIYRTLTDQVTELLREEPWYVAAMSNISALLMEVLPDLNWAGFYLMRRGRLVVGPFQGRPACIHIETGKGVCGTAVDKGASVTVPDVHAFPGHIACDSASASEIVIPVRREGRIAAVLDIDSPRKDRFYEEDRLGLEEIVRVMETHLIWE